MNRKQTLLILAALVLIGALGWWSLSREKASWRSGGVAAGAKVLGDFDLNAVAQVVITSGGNVIHLVRKDDAWTVKERGDYPAAFTQVGDLVRKLWELKVTEAVKVGPSQLGRLNLEPPAKDKNTTGTLVDLQDASGKRIAALIVGKPFTRKSPGMPDEAPGYPIGRYVLPVREGATAALVSEPLLDANAVATAWLDRTFYQATAVQSLTSKSPTPADAWTISRAKDTDDWNLEGLKADEKVDPAKASQAVAAVQSPQFSDVRAPGEGKEFAKATVLTLKTFDHFTYQLTVGAAEGELVPVKVAISAEFPPTRTPGAQETPEQKTQLDANYTNQLKQLHDKLLAEKRAEKWVYLLAKSSLDPALIPRASLLAPKATPSPSPAAAAPAPSAP